MKKVTYNSKSQGTLKLMNESHGQESRMQALPVIVFLLRLIGQASWTPD